MNYVKVAKWILILGGLALGYRGIVGTDLIGSLFGSLAMYADLLVGAAALYLGYVMLTSKK